MFFLWQGLFGAPPIGTQAGFTSLLGYWIGGGASDGGGPAPSVGVDWIIRARRRRSR